MYKPNQRQRRIFRTSGLITHGLIKSAAVFSLGGHITIRAFIPIIKDLDRWGKNG